MASEPLTTLVHCQYASRLFLQLDLFSHPALLQFELKFKGSTTSCVDVTLILSLLPVRIAMVFPPKHMSWPYIWHSYSYLVLSVLVFSPPAVATPPRNSKSRYLIIDHNIARNVSKKSQTETKGGSDRGMGRRCATKQEKAGHFQTRFQKGHLATKNPSNWREGENRYLNNIRNMFPIISIQVLNSF